MEIIINTPAYNERRYGRPWIARVDFATDPRGEFIWGKWVGQPGERGELIVEAQPGDVVANGQKDMRQPKNSAPSWSVVGQDGHLIDYTSKIDAVHAARDIKAAA